MATLEVALTGNVALTSDRESASGKNMGKRGLFHSTMNAADLKTYLKNSGLKGNELKKAVHAALTGAKDMAWIRAQAALQMVQSAGFVPDYFDQNAKGTSITMKFIKPTDVKATAASVKTADLSAEEKKALIARLTAELAAK